MKKIAIYMLLGVLLMAIMPPAASQEENAPIISLMIDVDTTPSPGYEEIRAAESNLHTIFGQIANRDGTGTIFSTQDVTSSRIRLLLAQYSVLSTFEFAISGNRSDDQLSILPISEQEALIKNSVRSAEAARVCDMSDVNVTGFMPPGFDQNEDTYRAIDNLGFMYDAGFQAGLIYAPGHEEDVWPYMVEGYNFSAVPISTVDVSGELVPLYDKKVAEEGMSAAEWGEILTTKLDESAANDEPMVVLLSTSVSGTGEYLGALIEFLDYAVSEDAIFVNARDLVTIAKTGNLTLPEGGTWECPTCGEDEAMDLNIVLVEKEDASLVNESEPNESSDQEAEVVA
ncbi:MAG TPA: hypothetical protein HA349_07530 [Methanotrichaceae archaeon]|nr:hypothetical protein [Methanotrichaceae archaeon]